MRKYLIAAAAYAAISLAGCAPDRPTETIKVKAGTPTIVGFMTLHTVQCDDWAPPVGTLSTPPRSGTVRFEVQRRPFTNSQSQCNGQSMSGRATIYTPNPGFKGTDKFTVQYVYDSNDGGGSANQSAEYIVDVK